MKWRRHLHSGSLLPGRWASALLHCAALEGKRFYDAPAVLACIGTLLAASLSAVSSRIPLFKVAVARDAFTSTGSSTDRRSSFEQRSLYRTFPFFSSLLDCFLPLIVRRRGSRLSCSSLALNPGTSASTIIASSDSRTCTCTG